MKKVLILGSGGLKIGQAGEFDYSGNQALKALKEEKIHTILVNPNIATVQTDNHAADTLYLSPLTIHNVTKIIEKERPCGILLGFGGQTALNLGLKLYEKGILQKYNVKVLGTSVESIQLTEDRDSFKKELSSIGILSPKSYAVTTVKEAVIAAKEIGYPIMMRSGFSLGGLGSGKIVNEEELLIRAKEALAGSPQILIEEFLFGWKEFEYEIVRDKNDNALTICNMENMDPMGIHTGESIVVAPSQTLNNFEYHRFRELAIKAAKHFKIVGECNIQFALNPKNGDYRVIEMNARLSRSSALASKATGYPLAFVATKLALGYLLYEIKNAVTQKTMAFFEPALDYVTVKIPRWDIQKLRFAKRQIGTEMKSVGEVMSIGRNFKEALQKAVRMLNIGASGICDYPHKIHELEHEIEFATDRRLFALYQFFKKGGSVEKANELSQIDKWFLKEIKEIESVEKELEEKNLSKQLLHKAKKFGFSDLSIAKIKLTTEEKIRSIRKKYQIIPSIKQIDTLAGEFDAKTNYLYVTYHGTQNDLEPSIKKPIIVLGSGPYSIGSSVEFDWCAVNTCRSLKKLNETAIIINSNPETVSTDYDESDRLYFEELTLERVQDIADFESSKGIIVSVGGQVANNLAVKLFKNGYSILGTSPKYIDQAENRNKFSLLLNQMNIDQPFWQSVVDIGSAKKFARDVGYPILIRPSYVLSGSAMNLVYSEENLQKLLTEASVVSPDYPVVISKFIKDAKELEIDGVAQNGEIIIDAISEHVENAGVHSGDATIVLPPQRLNLETIRKTKKTTAKIVKALNITGPFNVQFVAKNNDIKVIEFNARASRSFPFVSKLTCHNFIDIAVKAMLNVLKPSVYETLELDYVGVKSPQFSYHRLKGANPVAHVEMGSTGEVACLGFDFQEAFFNSWMATDQTIKRKKVLLSISDDKKHKLLEQIKKLDKKGWDIYATEGTNVFLAKNGIASRCVFKASEKIEPNITTVISKQKVDLIINIPQELSQQEQSDGFIIRRIAIDHHIPLITNLQIAKSLLLALCKIKVENLEVKSYQDFVQQKLLKDDVYLSN